MVKKIQGRSAIIHRLKIVEGHLKKVREMVEEGTYCIDILNQTRAVKNAITQVDVLLLDDHLHSCVIQDIKNGKQKSVDELLTIFKKINM